MKKETAEKVALILAEIKSLSAYKEILQDKTHGRIAHFELCQHYGSDPRRVVFEHKYTLRFTEVVEKIIKELNDELENIN